jgi:acetyl esterase
VLDPDVQAMLDRVLVPMTPPFGASRLRVGHGRSQDLLGGVPTPVHLVDGFAVAPDERLGTPRLAVRRYQPRPGCPRAIVWLHGGGWVIGTLDSYDAVARALAVASDSQIFVVDYRLSPEAPYPAPLADCSAAFEAIWMDAARFGIDPARVVLGGDSAGGHLAVGVARWLAALGSSARPAALTLVYPVTDARMRHASYARFSEGYFLTAAQMAWFWQQFAPRGAGMKGEPVTLEHPDLSPLLAHDLHRLPATLLVAAECDILHDEGVAFAGALANAGVRHEHLEIPGMIHGFLRFRAHLRQARDLPGQITEQLDRWGI